MSFQRMKFFLLFAVLAAPCSVALAAPMVDTDLSNWEMDRASAIASFALPASGSFMPLEASRADSVPTKAAPAASGLRKLLADFAMTLRDIRYRRGGREPSTGFDCSGFVHYVFQHTLGKNLPADSASQYLAGAKVDRADLKTGDLVFFGPRGKRVSHVGIYLGDGRFIHSPSSGKHVSVSALSETYWAKHFVGAKRPSVLS